MLESPGGRQRMADIGVNTVDHHRRRREAMPYTDDTRSMPDYVTLFLRTVRNDFFKLYLSSRMDNVGAVAEAEVCGPSGDIRNYEPKEGGHIKLCKMVIENMVYAARVALDPTASPAWRQNALRNFDSGWFQMGFAMAHEVVHK
ncbi:hypothetical protein B0I37DRAFT_197349 [Chaetomium sp. MPI-CAGE-AT-0009]|nr:hypothetical protein B0I37DRAFT_197349 [Chaetomium sp. MPI-CAGE-AT-0009]